MRTPRSSLLTLIFVLTTPMVWTQIVQVPGDYPTIQEAIDAAILGDTIIVAPGLYSETINFSGKVIRLRSSGGSSVTTIDGNGVGSVVTWASGEPPGTLLEGFTITGGSAPNGGGLFAQATCPTVVDCRFTQNVANQQGTAATGQGGGVFLDNCCATIVSSTFVGNQALGSDLEATGQGGGLCAVGVGSLAIANCTFSDNLASGGAGVWTGRGGGLMCSTGVTLRDSMFMLNEARATGGPSGLGGAVVISLLDATISDCAFVQNKVTGLGFTQGGGVWAGEDARVAFSNCDFVENEAIFEGLSGLGTGSFGGGASLEDSPSTSFVNCRFIGNRADNGGAIRVSCANACGDSVPIINCILFENEAVFGGGGVWIQDFIKPSLVHCTLVGNRAVQRDGGGIYTGPGAGTPETQVTNTILWENSPNAIQAGGGSPTDVTHSCVQGGSAGVGNIDDDPRFQEPATGDLHLRIGSPCINAGANSASHVPQTDIDGEPRVLCDLVDMGADESPSCGPPLFIRGDADGSGDFNGLADGIFILNFGFVPGSPLAPCEAAADADGDLSLTPIADGLYLLNFQFGFNSPPPPPPFPDCGVDIDTIATLGCGEPDTFCNP